MISVVCFWWNNKQGHILPSQKVTTYDETWVVKLYNMVSRNYDSPFKFICVTDSPDKLVKYPHINVIPIWNDFAELGGCYRRLKIFSLESELLFGKRFIAIDLDCVITGNLKPIFDRTDDFVIHKYSTTERDQRYNGSLILMNAGARSQVWTRFGEHAPIVIKSSSNTVIGTDQAWIRLVLGPNEKTFTEEDGCYDIKHSKEMKNGLPANAKMIFFSGPRDPQTESSKNSWIGQYWK